ncbi:unnamed protein product, partial [Iphiclides podalirius]
MFLGVKEKVLSCFAGVEENFVTTSLLNGCDLLICTASFLVRLLQITDFGVDMRRLATVVLDDCERLAEVYGTEVKYILYRIKDSIKNRTNKELKIQYIIASRKWCDFMEPIAKRAPYSVVCIGALQECVLYSKANMSVNFVHQENKVDSVHKFLTELDLTKKIVIVCRNDEETVAMGKVNTDPNGKAEEMRPVIFPKMLLQPKCEVKELDSDDYTSPECSESVTASEKQIKTACDLDKTRKPKLIWRQNRNLVVIRINLIGLQKYNLTIQGRSLTFAATLSDVDYAFDLELYGATDVSKSSHCNKGQYVLVKLSKILNKNWLTLTKDGGIRKWIVYDVDSIDVSSDVEAVEEQNNITVLNAIKNIHNQDETESEDDDFIDDISYRQAKYTVRYHK